MFARDGSEALRREWRQLISRILFEWGTGYAGFGLIGPHTSVFLSRPTLLTEKRGRMAVDCGERVAHVEGLACADRSDLWDRGYAGKGAHPHPVYPRHRREAA